MGNIKTFTAQLVITTQCNLACKYCYMKNETGKMTVEDLSKIRNSLPEIIEKYGCNKYNITYFGGEPLSNWEAIRDGDWIFASDPLCMCRTIVSNGLLLDDYKVKYIKENHLGFSWSFDGLWNNNNRVYINGSSSLDDYLSKIDLIQKLVPNNCKVMVSPSSISTLVENYVYLKKLGITGIDFTLVRDDIWKDEDVENFKGELHKLAQLYIRDIKEGNSISVGFFTLALLDMYIGRKYGKRQFSCFAGNSGLGFMPDGKAYACARFGSAKEHPIYNYYNGEWDNESFNLLNDPKVYNPATYEYCNDCAIRQYCNGGCNYEHIKNGYTPVKTVCALYKSIYKESLYVLDKLENNGIFNNMLAGALRNAG